MKGSFSRPTLVLACLILCCCLHAQKKWIGSSSGIWNDAQNWQPAGLPGLSDDVTLDNSYTASDYTVTLPDNIVTINSLTIAPAASHQIEVILPSTNRNNNAFNVGKAGDAICIKAGGVFRNSSGLTNGQSLSIRGEMYIYNGGKYIHNTRAAHATDIVSKLSGEPGTETGAFEFDVPGGSYPVSLSSRTYGKLIFSAHASGGTQTYNGSGAGILLIRGNLQVNDGVQLNVDFSRDIVISGDFIQYGGIINLASQSNNNVVKISGNLHQASAGVITETASGLPVIELAGNISQQINLRGTINNSITIRINNRHGAALANELIIPYKLQLITGRLKTDLESIITVPDGCTIEGASVNSFIEGPLKKLGDEDFEFPIGKQGDYAPVTVAGKGGVNDVFIAEYFLADPAVKYGAASEAAHIVRISSLEYWHIERVNGASLKKVSLSVRTYSNATALEKLVITRWDPHAGAWKNHGNSAYAGVSTGVVTSNELTDFGAFSLASTTQTQNPLPTQTVSLNASRAGNYIEVNWQISTFDNIDSFEVERSFDGVYFEPVKTVRAESPARVFNCRFLAGIPILIHVRLKVISKHGSTYYSGTISLPEKPRGSYPRIQPSISLKEVRICIDSKSNEEVQVFIMDVYGRIVKKADYNLPPGVSTIVVNIAALPPGVYVAALHSIHYGSRAVTFTRL